MIHLSHRLEAIELFLCTDPFAFRILSSQVDRIAPFISDHVSPWNSCQNELRTPFYPPVPRCECSQLY